MPGLQRSALRARGLQGPGLRGRGVPGMRGAGRGCLDPVPFQGQGDNVASQRGRVDGSDGGGVMTLRFRLHLWYIERRTDWRVSRLTGDWWWFWINLWGGR